MKTMIKFFGLFIVAVSFFILSCDKIEEPYKVAPGSNPDPDTTVFVKKVLIEDYTGHRCGNCPGAHIDAHILETTYPGKVIPIGIHVGWYATPLGAYTADYRTTVGDELDAVFQADAAGLPTGCVNRVEDQGSKLISHGKWGTIAGQLLALPPNVGITIDNTYDSASKEVGITVDVKILENISNDLFLTIYIVEDSIVSRQLDYDATPNDIDNYVHRHVLRDAVNTTWGEKIFTGGAILNDTIQKPYNYTLNASWNENQCSIIAFVYDETTQEIYQVEDKHIVQH